MKYEINAEKNAKTPKPPYRNEGRQILIHSERIVLTSPGVLASELVVLVVRHRVARIAESAAHLDAVDVGHCHIEQNQVGSKRGNCRECIEAAPCADNLKALESKRRRQQVGQVLLIVNDEDPRLLFSGSTHPVIQSEKSGRILRTFGRLSRPHLATPSDSCVVANH